MAADSSWGEVRWREPQEIPSSNDSIMATRTLLAGNKTFTTEGREEQHARLMEPHLRIEHGVHAPQSNLYTRAPVNRLDDTRLHSESRYPLNYTQDTSYGQQKTAMTSRPGGVDEIRTGPIFGQIDQSRRTSELQPISDAPISGSDLFLCPLFDDKHVHPLSLGHQIVA